MKNTITWVEYDAESVLGLLIIVFWLQWTAVSACIEEKACSDPRTKPVYIHGACVCLERAR